METNCPKCLAPATNQSNYCFNCGNLLNKHLAVESADSADKYRKVLVTIALLVLGCTAFQVTMDSLRIFDFYPLYSVTRFLNWLIIIAIAGLPFIISFALPKKAKFKKLLFIGGLVAAGAKLILLLLFEFSHWF